jgi:hypothetical protein
MFFFLMIGEKIIKITKELSASVLFLKRMDSDHGLMNLTIKTICYILSLKGFEKVDFLLFF